MQPGGYAGNSTPRLPRHIARHAMAVPGLQSIERRSQSGLFAQLQSLLDTTFLRRRSCDRKGPMPARLKLCDAFVAQMKGEVWEQYLRQRDVVASRSPEACPVLEPLARTHGVLDLGTGPQVNECHLFHGTSVTSAFHILHEGFKIKCAGQSTRARFGSARKCMFAQGLYFSECASKADEYATYQGPPAATGRRTPAKPLQLFPVLLCRVILGRVLRVRRALDNASDPYSLQNKLRLEKCDSLVGDLEVQCRTYREFVIPQADLIFPEYLLLYRRLYGPPAGPWSSSPSSRRKRNSFRPT